MAWRAARSIPTLHAQLKAGSRAAPPATQAAEWGTVGDLAHTSTSDHSPHDFPGWGNDIVTAADFPNRPDLGLDARRVLDDIRRSHDPRVKYGISNGQMFSSYATSQHPAWTWRPYGGSDGHFTHGHLSVVGDARADGTQPWATIGGSMSGADTEAIIKAWSVGMPTASTGSTVEPVKWRISDEGWQKRVEATLAAIAAKVDIDADELAAIQESARLGATAAIAAGAQQLAEAVITAVRDELDEADAERIGTIVQAQLRSVFADAGQA